MSVREMLDFTIAFSELVKNARLYFEHALDSEKRQLVTEVFLELVFKDRGPSLDGPEVAMSMFALNLPKEQRRE